MHLAPVLLLGFLDDWIVTHWYALALAEQLFDPLHLLFKLGLKGVLEKPLLLVDFRSPTCRELVLHYLMLMH